MPFGHSKGPNQLAYLYSLIKTFSVYPKMSYINLPDNMAFADSAPKEQSDLGLQCLHFLQVLNGINALN